MKTILFPLAVAALAVPGYAQNVRAPQQLDAGLARPIGPAVASTGDLTAALWKEDGTNNMYAVVSNDNGISWGTPVRVDDDVTIASKYAGDSGLAISGGNIYATWSDDRNAAFDADIQFTVSSDGGLTWSPNVALPKGFPSAANDVKNWKILADGNTVVVVEAVENDLGGFNEEMFFTVSLDGGLTWGAAVAASLHPNGLIDVDSMWAAMSNGTLHIAWQDNSTSASNEAFYSSYDLASSTFNTQDVLVSAGMAGGHVEWDLGIAANGNTVAICMQADNLPTASADVMHVNVSTDGGLTWNGDVQVGGYIAGTNDTDHPVILVTSAGNVIVAAEDNRNGGDEIFIHTSVDGGLTWTESASMGGGGYPSIGGNGDYVAVNWTGPAYPEGSMAVASSDGGVTWGAPFDMAIGQLNDADYAEIAFNETYANFVAVWLDDSAVAINQLFAGGFRSQGLTAVGPFVAGQPVNFTGAGWGASEVGNTFMVVVSTASGYGSAFLPGDGRDIGIGMSPTLMASTSIASLSGTIVAGGTAATPTLTMPGRFPVGSSLYAMAISRGTGFGSLSDAVTVVVQ
jgi:hypothetical protein